ncbi:MAG: retroviral-like aspartic protease family protein [Muribaculaceae bacterium]|nr:retroviral-like aspartic protease family protein [Muribaculaceae bacterium]
MKLKILILISFLSAVTSLWAKSEVKQRDSYAYTRGVEEYQNGNLQDALDWFDKELSEHPDNGYAYIYISVLRFDNQEYGKALSAIDNALKRLPKKDKEWRALAFDSRAEIYAALNDTVKAIADLSQAIQMDPSNSRFYNSRAQLNYEQKNYALADADYQKMISLDQGDIMGYMGMGRNANAQERWDDATQLFDKVTKLEPDYSPGYSFRASAYIGQQKWAEATDDIVKALDLDGNDRTFVLMQTLPAEATDLLKSKLKIQMAKQPANRYWPYCIAVLDNSRNDFDEAISFYEKANAIDADPLIMENISKCYVGKGEFAKALEYADRALDMNPDDYDVVDLKADILSGLGRFDECLAERDKYVAQYPERHMAYLYRAEDLMNVKRYSDAVEDYNTAIVLSPDLAEAPYLLMKRGDAYRLKGMPEYAAKDYEALLDIEKDSVLTSDSWTPFAYSGLGDSVKAIETMQFILANDTTDVSGNLYNAACIYARLGNAVEATKYLKDAVEHGYTNFTHLAADYDLDCIRNTPEYQEILNMKATEIAPEDIKTQDEPTEYRTEIVEVPFSKEGGVTKVKCTINELPLHFVFDTGAADVTMSMVEANFMLKNDYIKPSDIIGSARYMDANGDITEGTIINLRKVDFGGLELENVRASVVRNQKAPLLLGQSVLGRLGKIEIDNPKMKLVITHRVNK